MVECTKRYGRGRSTSLFSLKLRRAFLCILCCSNKRVRRSPERKRSVEGTAGWTGSLLSHRSANRTLRKIGALEVFRETSEAILPYVTSTSNVCTSKTSFCCGLKKTQVTVILECIGEDPSREGLVKTPERVAKVFRQQTASFENELRERDTVRLVYAK